MSGKGFADDLPDDVRRALRAESVPTWSPPTLATLTDKRFSDQEWLFERKLDGMRCLAFRDGDRVRLRSRNRQRLDDTYPEIGDALAAQEHSRFVLDGEVVAFDGRHTSFSRLQQRLGITDRRVASASPVAVYYYVFDLLHLDGYSTVDVPLLWRKRLLHRVLHFDDPLRYSTHRIGAGAEAYQQACARGDEGVIAKSTRSRYPGRRSSSWLKFKCVRDQEFVIGGYTSPRGSRVGLGSLLVGYYAGEELVYAGRVGTGFDTATLRSLHERLAEMELDSPPFADGRSLPRMSNGAVAHWVRPELIAQIGFTEWTKDGRLRHPRYTGLRTDKKPADVVKESS